MILQPCVLLTRRPIFPPVDPEAPEGLPDGQYITNTAGDYLVTSSGAYITAT